MKKKKDWKNIAAPVLALLALAIATLPDILRDWRAQQAEPSSLPQVVQPADNQALFALMAQKRGGEMVAGYGVVQKVLKDDNDGSRHQRFILDVGQGKTLLVAHNIDLAPRVANLKTGDTVRFFGQYETNHRDGVLHWTHRDPAGRHAHGWLEHQGKRYQ